MTPDSDSPFEALLREVVDLGVPEERTIELPKPGTVLQGKYRVEERLGKGGMGVVFRATNVETEKQVAIKWLLGRTPQAGQRFFREACLTAKIDHPNVVNAFDYGTHQDGRYLVMELLRGESLGSRIRREQRLGSDELIEIMIPVLRGLAAAHRAGVIHRDLKPDNVFLCVGSDGTPRPPKVLDFGVSKLRSPLPVDEGLTGQGTGLGTVAYMSPQQLLDANSVDERADIYAAGVMMYEALTGCRPFRAESYNALVVAITMQHPRPMAALVPDVPRALERIVMRAMSKKPEERQPDVLTLINELQTLSHDAPPTGARGGRHGSAPLTRWTWALGMSLPLSIALWFSFHPPERTARRESTATSRAPVRTQVAIAVDKMRAPAPSIASDQPGPASPSRQPEGARLRSSQVSRSAAARLPKTARLHVAQTNAPVPSPSGKIDPSDLY